MGGNNDWRLTNQEKFLKGSILVRKRYVKPREDWDHDHCVFCWAKFMEDERSDALNEGYVTSDGRHWICLTCFHDFHESFEWKVELRRQEEHQ